MLIRDIPVDARVDMDFLYSAALQRNWTECKCLHNIILCPITLSNFMHLFNFLYRRVVAVCRKPERRPRRTRNIPPTATRVASN